MTTDRQDFGEESFRIGGGDEKCGLIAFTTSTPGGVMSGGATFLGCAGGAALLVFGIWYLVILFDYRNAFRVAAAEARSFASDGGPKVPRSFVSTSTSSAIEWPMVPPSPPAQD